MKKLFFILAAACALVACDPVKEDITNNSSITAEQLKEMTIVKTDKAASGKNGNVITCETHAPVVAGWNIAGKDYPGNYVQKKVKLGEQVVTMTALCGDGTEVKVDFPLNVEEITDPLTKYYIYDGEPFTVTASGDAGETRFSDNEGKHFPFIKGDVYFGLKTLIFEIVDAQVGPGIWGMADGCTLRVMNGWWSSTYADDVEITPGLWELPITDVIAAECAPKDAGGEGRDLNLLVTRGTITFGKVYYEE